MLTGQSPESDNAEHSSLSSFRLRVQPMNSEELENEVEKVDEGSTCQFMRTTSDNPIIKQRSEFFKGLKNLQCPNTFSSQGGNADSDQPHSAASFSGHGGI